MDDELTARLQSLEERVERLERQLADNVPLTPAEARELAEAESPPPA
jgi:hypothetical protein